MRRILPLLLALVVSCLLPACGGAGGGGGGGGGGAAPTETTFVHLATAANRFEIGADSWTEIDHAACNGVPTAKLIVTPWRTGGSSASPTPIYVGYVGGHWFIYSDSADPLPVGAAFTVTVASDAFTHVGVLGDGINPTTTEIVDPSLENQPNAVFFITRNAFFGNFNFGLGSRGAFGVTYFPPAGPLPGRWAIQSEGGTSTTTGYQWNVLVRSSVSPAVRHTALPANTGAGAGIGLFDSETQTPLVNSALGMHVLHVRPLIAPIPLLTSPGAVAGGVLMNVFHQDGSAVPIGEQFFVWRP